MAQVKANRNINMLTRPETMSVIVRKVHEPLSRAGEDTIIWRKGVRILTRSMNQKSAQGWGLELGLLCKEGGVS